MVCARGANPGRTAVECTRDRLANLIGRDIATTIRAASVTSLTAVDLFAGSGNTLHWIKTHAGARKAIGFELDDTAFSLAHANLSLMDVDIDLRHDSYLRPRIHYPRPIFVWPTQVSYLTQTWRTMIISGVYR